VGKRKAESLIYSTVIWSWLALPVALLDPSAVSWIAWLAYAAIALVVVVWTVRAVRVEVDLV
jgi:hypothetical protein